MSETIGTGGASAVGPPVNLLYAAAVQLVVGIALILVESRGVHVLGWVIGALAVPATALRYRTVDRRRRRSPVYVHRSGVSNVPTVVLVLGIAVAVANAYRYFEQTVVV